MELAQQYSGDATASFTVVQEMKPQNIKLALNDSINS